MSCFFSIFTSNYGSPFKSLNGKERRRNSLLAFSLSLHVSSTFSFFIVLIFILFYQMEGELCYSYSRFPLSTHIYILLLLLFKRNRKKKCAARAVEKLPYNITNTHAFLISHSQQIEVRLLFFFFFYFFSPTS